MDEVVYNDLQKLSRLSEHLNITTTISYALSLYLFVQEALQKGGKILVSHNDGTTKEVEIL